MAESIITVSLGAGATYDIYKEMFLFLAGKAAWQTNPLAGGWNIALNGDDVNVFDVDDEGIWARPPTDDTWQTFGENRFLPWDDIDSIVIH
jgi:hypothetical protein